MRCSQRNRIGSARAAIGGSASLKTMLMAEGARYQAVKPHHQRVEPLREATPATEDNAFHLSADESRWIGFSEDDVSKEAEHFRNARSGDSRVIASPRRNDR